MERPPEEPMIGSVCSDCQQVIKSGELKEVRSYTEGRRVLHKCFFKSKMTNTNNIPLYNETDDILPHNEISDIPSCNVNIVVTPTEDENALICFLCRNIIAPNEEVSKVQTKGPDGLIQAHTKCVWNPPQKESTSQNKKRNVKNKKPKCYLCCLCGQTIDDLEKAVDIINGKWAHNKDCYFDHPKQVGEILEEEKNRKKSCEVS